MPPKKKKQKRTLDSDSEDDHAYESEGDAGGDDLWAELEDEVQGAKDDVAPSPTVETKAEDSGSESMFDDGYDANLYGDEEDRANLDAMAEMEREMVLAERYERRQQLEVEWRAKHEGKLLKKKQKEQKSSSRSSGSKRKASARVQRQNALADLKQRRAGAGTKGRVSAAVHDDSSEEYVDDEGATLKNRYKQLSTPTKSSQRGSQEYSPEHTPLSDIDLAQVHSAWLSRTLMEKWFREPFFERTVVGCFARVGIGMFNGEARYRLVYITGVRHVAEHDEYLVDKEAKDAKKRSDRCGVLLVVSHGANERDFKITSFSRSEPSESELLMWKSSMRSDDVALPSAEEIASRVKALHAARTYVKSNAEVAQMVKKNKQKTGFRANSAQRRAELQARLDEAISMRNVEQEQHIRDQIEQLEEERKQAEQRKKAHAGLSHSLAVINQRNRATNIERLQLIALEEAKKKKLHHGKDTLDPFSRRKTAPTLIINLPGQNNKTNNNNGDGADGESNNNTQEEEDKIKEAEEEEAKKGLKKARECSALVEALRVTRFTLNINDEAIQPLSQAHVLRTCALGMPRGSGGEVGAAVGAKKNRISLAEYLLRK